jgi:superfamily II DNA/RNA helicase
MLDMGFYDDIMKVTKHIPEKRQTLMFSATMPPKIRDLAKKILTDPSEVNIAISKPAEGILQAAYMVYDTQKIPLLNTLLREKDLPSILIFSSRKQTVKEIVQSLRRNGFNADAIHSDLEQTERENVLREFKNRNVQILVATDIIARGIDIEKIDLVINYDVPRDAEDYVHRVGRTARAETQGVAITLINQEDQMDFYKIERLIEKDIYKIPLPSTLGDAPEYRAPEMFKSGKYSNKKGFKRNNKKNFNKKNRGFKNRDRK